MNGLENQTIPIKSLVSKVFPVIVIGQLIYNRPWYGADGDLDCLMKRCCTGLITTGIHSNIQVDMEQDSLTKAGSKITDLFFGDYQKLSLQPCGLPMAVLRWS